MAIGDRRRGSVRDITTLARRVHERWLAYRRRHPGMSIPVDDTLSRLFEHVPEYIPHRERSPQRQERASKSPGIFKLQKVAETLGTTVGDLLGEPGYESPRELLSLEQRRTLRRAMRMLRDLFDLDDESLDEPDEPSNFAIPPQRFVARDYDYPRALHAWVVPEMAASGGIAEDAEMLSPAEVVHSMREIADPRLQVVRVVSDAMEPELRDGWKVLVDTRLTRPADGALVAVYSREEGGLLGRWQLRDGRPVLHRTNPNYEDIALDDGRNWLVWGTVTRIVEAPARR